MKPERDWQPTSDDFAGALNDKRSVSTFDAAELVGMEGCAAAEIEVALVEAGCKPHFLSRPSGTMWYRSQIDLVKRAGKLWRLIPHEQWEGRFGFVYGMQCDATKLVKIGWAKDPLRRLADLQTGSAPLLRIVAKGPGTRLDEAGRHAAYADQRARGEWFEDAVVKDLRRWCRASKASNDAAWWKAMDNRRFWLEMAA